MVEPVTYAMRLSWNIVIVCAELLFRSSYDRNASGNRQEKARRPCAIRASRRRKQSTVGLYWINSNIEDMSREEGRECSNKNKKKPKIGAVRIPKAITKLPVSGTGNVRFI